MEEESRSLGSCTRGFQSKANGTWWRRGGNPDFCFFFFSRILPHPQPSRKHPTSWEFPQQDMVQGPQVKVMPSVDQGD